jgi:NADH dehydrogenase
LATSALSPADIDEPPLCIVRTQPNFELYMSFAQSIDAAGHKVVTDNGDIEYNYLVISTGARHHYFGHDEWEHFAPGLKSLDDALEIRRRMLMAFELAEKTHDDAQRRAAMTFVVVGGGPTGVEMAGAIAEIARQTLVRDFRHIDSSHARVLLIENSDRVLTVFDSELSESARRQLFEIGVEIKLGSTVTVVDAEGVTLSNGERIGAKTVVWAAGNKASPLGATLGVPMDRGGRVIVEPDLTVPGHPEIYVIGDLANCGTPEGIPLPGLAAVAIQQGPHVARNIARTIRGGWREKFEYVDKGTMATIGRHSAIADLGFVRLHGLPAWLAWLFIHLMLLVGYRSRVAVFFSWAYTYLVYGRKARLITGRL